MKSIISIVFIALLWAGLRYIGVTEVMWEQLGMGIPENPTYYEFRTSIPSPRNDIEMMAVGRLKSEAECGEVLGMFQKDFLEGCPTCKISRLNCPTDLNSQYSALVNNQPWHLPYVAGSLTLSSYRSVGFAFLGMTQVQAKRACDQVARQLAYLGMSCIHAR